MIARAWALVGLLHIACAPQELANRAASSPANSATESSSPAPAGSVGPAASVSAAPDKSELGPSTKLRATRLFDGDVSFFVTGEKGRLGLLAREGDSTVPHRFEAGRWERLELPKDLATSAEQRAHGIYFGRDNRPRLMGHREVGGATKVVYLRFKDGRWRDQRGEVGALASDDAALFGVLGEADPELVCKRGGTCLIKRRSGWKEIPETVGTLAVMRAFYERGYALTKDGLFEATDKGFVRLGPSAPWTTTVTGFWVGPDRSAVVVEPEKDAIHTLEPGAEAWRTSASPIGKPRDVAGASSNRFVVGDGGAAHGEGTLYARLGEANLRLSRVIVLPGDVLAAGPSGVFRFSGP